MVFAGYGIVVPDSPGFRLRQLRRRSTSRTRSSSCCATSPRTPIRRPRAILAATRICATRRWPRASTAPRRILVVTGPRSPNAGELVADDASTRRSPDRASSPRASPARSRDAIFSAATGQDARRGAAVARYRQSARRRLRDSRTSRSRVTPTVVREKQDGHNIVAYLPATDADDRRRPSRGSRWARTTIISATATAATRWRGKEETGQIHPAPTTTRRARPRCSRSPRALSKQPRRRNVLLEFWSGEELGLLGSTAFVDEAAGAARSARGLPELRHGRPDAGQQAHRAGDGHQRRRGRGFSNRPTSPPDSICSCSRIRISRPTSPAFNQAGVPSPEFLHRHPRRLPPSDRHRRQDRLRGSRSHRRRSPRTSPRRLEELDEPPPFTKVDQPTEHGAGRAGRARLHRHDSGLHDRGQRTAARRRDRRRTGRTGRSAEGRRHRRDRRADDRQHLRLHLRARAPQDRPAGQGRLYARRQADRDDADAAARK